MTGTEGTRTPWVEQIEELRDQQIEVPLEGAVGTVVLDRFGEMLQLKISRKALTYADASLLGSKILRAIQDAQEQAEQRLAELLPRPPGHL